MSSGTEAIDRKQRIRDRYRGVDTSELEVIPAKIVEGLGESTSIRRVAAYVRVSTDNDEQTSSYELQKNYYTDYIKAQAPRLPCVGQKALHRKTIPPRKKKLTVGHCEGRVAKQRKSSALKNRISEIKEAHLVTIRLA